MTIIHVKFNSISHFSSFLSHMSYIFVASDTVTISACMKRNANDLNKQNTLSQTQTKLLLGFKYEMWRAIYDI